MNLDYYICPWYNASMKKITSLLYGIDTLSPRQIEVVKCRCGEDELSVDETGSALNVSPQTIKNHSTLVISRLGVRSFHGVCTLYGQYISHKDSIVRSDDL